MVRQSGSFASARAAQRALMKRKPGLFFVLCLVVGVPCLLGIGLIYYGLRSAHAGLEREIASARQSGMPLSMSEIPMPTGPEAKNAAPLYRRATVLLNGSLKGPQGAVTKGWSLSATPKEIEAGRQMLPALSPLMDVCRQLPDRPFCNFQRDWSLTWNVTFPELASMRSMVRDLCAAADKQDKDGGWQGALKNMRLVHRISEDAASDPCLIGLLVQVSIRSIADREYEKLIGRHPRDSVVLNAIDRQIRAESDLPDLRRALSGEIAMGYMGRQSPKDLELGASEGGSDEQQAQVAPAKGLFQSQAFRDSLESVYLSEWLPAWKKFPSDNQDWAGFGTVLKTVEKAVESDTSLIGRINGMMMPALGAMTDAVGVLQAHDRLLIDSIAVLRERLRTGRLPVVLPPSLGELRLDPFDGQALRYRREGSGFTLYSIGKDRVDNGGKRRPAKPSEGEQYDEVVSFG